MLGKDRVDMNIRDLLKKSSQLINNPIEVSGWVVFIKKQLYILDVSIEEFDDSDHLSRIKFKDRDIAYVLLDAIIFALGGGETAIYHMAFVNGTLLECDGELLLDVESIIVEDKQLVNKEDNTLALIRIPVDISTAAIAEAKLRDPHLFSDNPSGDWMDYM